MNTTTENPDTKFPYDWQIIASPGHVLMARLQRFAAWMFLPFLGLFILSAMMLFSVYGRQMVGIVPQLPQSFRAAFTFDANTYFDIGGKRVGPDLAFLADYKPGSAGITPAQWSGIVKALMADLATSGHDIKQWKVLATLDPQPIVTRPAKALTEHSKRLSTTGIITLPENMKDRRMAYAVAHIGGQWAFLIAAPGQCRVITGPDIAECPRDGGDGFNTRRTDWQAMKPKADK